MECNGGSLQQKERFKPGESVLAFYTAENKSPKLIIGVSTYNLNPMKISRSIGDVYLKKAEFNMEPLYAKFHLHETFTTPILSSEPTIYVHKLQPHDQFLIFSSDGLWEHLTNQEAVDIVQNSPHNLMLFGRIMTDGRLSARLKCDLTENRSVKANAQLTNEPHMSQGMFNFEYKGSDYRAQLQLGNGGLFGANYILDFVE